MDLTSTLLVLSGLLGLFGFCLWGARRPPHPDKVRLFPYIPVMMLCLVFILGFLAHLVSLVTGQPVVGRGGGF